MNQSMINSSSNQDDSDLVSYGGKKQTKLFRFISTISPSLMMDMKSYLLKNEENYQKARPDLNHKICLYEDILIIHTLKSKQDSIFSIKGELRQTLNGIALKTKKQLITINQRIHKKISQLTPQQLKYYIDSKRDVVFRGNSRIINTDDWPAYLKQSYKPHRGSSSLPSDVINIDSESQQRSHKSNKKGYMSQKQQYTDYLIRKMERKQDYNKNKNNNKNKTLIQEIDEIMNQPERTYIEPEHERTQIEPKSTQKTQTDMMKMAPNNFSQFRHTTRQDINQPLSAIDKAVLSKKVLEVWKQKYLPKQIQYSEKALVQGQILYNFKQRQYSFINLEIVMKAFNSIKQEQILQKVRKAQLIRRQTQKEHLIAREIESQDENWKEKSESKVKRIQIKTRKCAKSPDQKQIIEIFDDQPDFIELQQNIQLSQNIRPQQEKTQKNIFLDNPVRLLQQIASKYENFLISEEARELLQQGLKISELLKQEIQNREKQQIQKYKNSPQSGFQQAMLSPKSQISPKKNILYWFNNDSRLYGLYQEDPQNRRYLMWSDEEDESLKEINQNYKNNLGKYQTLTVLKTPKSLIPRLQFLKIPVRQTFQRFLERQTL